MMKRLLVMGIILSTWSLGGMACIDEGKGIMGDNDLEIPVGNSFSGIGEEEFHRVLDKLEELYAPTIQELGGRLVMIRDWASTTVNAYAQRQGKNWQVKMFGGLARHADITSDGFALVGCHELGHHLGGMPMKGTKWASNEGQSDYFASSKCFRRYVEDEDNVQIMSNVQVPGRVRAFCQEIHGASAEDVAVCERSSMAGLSLARLLAKSKKAKSSLAFESENRSLKPVGKTSHSHPAAQCRLDTYFQGALCYLGHDEKGYCSRRVGDHYGVRPHCWYRFQ